MVTIASQSLGKCLYSELFSSRQEHHESMRTARRRVDVYHNVEHEDNCVNITHSHVPSRVPQAFTDSILDPRFREAVTILLHHTRLRLVGDVILFV